MWCKPKICVKAMRASINALTVLATLVHGGYVWGQDSIGENSVLDMSLEELTKLEVPTVVGASKYEQTALQAPSSVTVISADEIRRFGYTTLADVLRSVRGFYVTNNRNYSFVGTRGFSRPGDFNSRILVMVDGHRVNDGIYGQGNIGGDFVLDIDLIERVEIIRGPGSSLYGTGAFFGVINVIPKRGKDFNGGEVALGVGGSKTHQARLTYGKKLDSGADVLLSVNGYETRGQRNLFYPEYAGAVNGGYASNADGERWKNAYGSLNYGGFSLSAGTVGRRKVVPSGLYDTAFGDSGTFTVDKHSYVDMQYQRDVGLDSNFHVRLYGDRYRYNADYLYDVPVYPSRTINKDVGISNWWGAELRFTTRIAQKHRITVGAEYVNNTASDQANYDADPHVVYNYSPYRFQTTALYVQDEFSVTDRLTMNLGLRADRQYQGVQSVNPRLAAIYSAWAGTVFKALYGTAFRAANSYERFASLPGLVANSALKPEEIKTTELVVEHSFRSNIRGVFSIYRYQLDKLVTQTFDPGLGSDTYVNGTRLNAHGFDVELQAKFKPIEGRVSYSQQVSKDSLTGLTLSNAPKHLVKLNLVAPVPKSKLSVAWETQYVSGRTNWQNQNVPASSVSNLTVLGRNLVKGLDITAGMYNVFDKRNLDPSSNDDASAVTSVVAHPQDRRQFLLRAYYRF
jgi:outer membrane receptor for ferrienterochelin and colicins